jgi:predicted ATPase
VLDRALVVVESTEERWWEAELHRIKGRILLTVGSADSGPGGEGEAALRRALAVASRQGARVFALRAASDLAELLLDRGSPTEASAMLGPLVTALSDQPGIPELSRAHQLLGR